MKYLNKINSPGDLKKLNINSLNFLCDEIRRFLLRSVSMTGGHLASNLGVVELTLAIHYCFDSPNDKIIWDVGHQAYIHKMLTGRRDQFPSLRQLDGLSGFPKGSESPHDAFDTGHSSTSISAALGYCLSRDLKKENFNVAAVIGDGSLTGGLALEALNNAGRTNTNLIVILNDNQMSISENVGALPKYLNNLRTAPSYLNAKADVNDFLNRVPVVGDKLIKAIGKTKETIKYILLPGMLFEEFGFNYVGPVEGHNLEELIRVLGQVKNMTGPVLLHVLTTKGKGYEIAEKSPSKFHGVESFDVETGKAIETKIWDTYSDVFGKELTRLAASNKKITAITAAMPNGTGLAPFQTAFPDRLFDVGIAEQHAVTFAAGMAKNGMTPVFAVYSTFLQRAYDQVVHDVCMQNLHVVFAIDRAGVVGADGETHQGLFDISFLSHVPNLMIMAPKNKNELRQMLAFAIEDWNGPVAIRYPRGGASRVLKEFNSEIQPGKSEIIERGEKIAIISLGTMMDVAYEVHGRLKESGLGPTLINARFVKPLDKDMILGLKDYEYIFVLEDGLLRGGYGSSILEYMSQENIPRKNFNIFAFPDEYVEQGTKEEIFLKYGMDADTIFKKIKSLNSDGGGCRDE